MNEPDNEYEKVVGEEGEVAPDEVAQEDSPKEEPNAEPTETENTSSADYAEHPEDIAGAPVQEIEHTTQVANDPPTPPLAAPTAQSGGGVLVLQWLSYAFWFWFSVSVSVLAGIVINYYVSSTGSYEWGNELAYPLAAVIIMLAIALVTDRFYAKHEPQKKVGGANVIMLLHVVPFILIAIGALVTIVFSCITMFLNSDPLATVDGPIKTMLVALAVAILFGLVAARAFYGKAHHVRKIMWITASVLAVGCIIATCIGPAGEAVATKDDRLIEQSLPSLASDIRTYAGEHDALPAKLTDVSHDSSYTAAAVQKLIDSKLVTYKPNTVADDSATYDPGDTVQIQSCVDSSTSGDCYSGSALSKRFYYQLCTTFKREKKSEYTYADDTSYTTGTSEGVASDYRYSYITSISAHPAGQVCYNLYADGEYSYSTEGSTSSAAN